MMSFLSTVVSSRFPTTNNQLRNSSNPRQQASIHDGRVIIQPVKGRLSSFAASTSGTRANISRIGGNNLGQQRVLQCFNCQGEGHMARQCPKLKRKRDASCPNTAKEEKDATWLEGIKKKGGSLLVEAYRLILVNILSHNKNRLMNKLSGYKLSHPNTNQFASSPVKIETPRELPKLSLVNTSLKKLKYHLSQFENVVKKHITPDALTEGEWGFEHTKAVFVNEIIPFVKTLKDIFNVFDKDLLNEVTEVQTIFNQMEAVVQQYHVDKQNNTSANQTEPSFDQLFELKYFKVKLEAKDTTIKKLKATIERLNKTSTTNNMKKDLDEIETINIELEHRVTKLNAKNEHLKQTYKQLYDSIKPSRVQAKEHDESLVNQLNQKSVEITDLNAQLQEKIIEQAKSLNPLDSASYSAYKYVKLIQELLGYVRDTCPDIHKPTKKLVVVTLINKKKTVRLKSTDNTKNDRIMQISSSTQKKNKVEDHSRIVKSSLNKLNFIVEPSGNAHVQHSKLNTNSELMCVKCNSSMFDAKHELCFLKFVSDMNASSKSKSVKKAKKKEEWKPTGKVFTKIGYDWRPTGRTFTLVRNGCPLTRITANNNEPLRKPIPLEVIAKEFVATMVYTRRPKVPKTNGSNSKPKIAKSMISNKMEPGTSRGSNTLVAPSYSSSIDLRILGNQPLYIVNGGYDGVFSNLSLVQSLKDQILVMAPMIVIFELCKKQSHKPKFEDTNQETLYLLHMDLCGPMRVASINGKKYILVIVDDYSWFTWVKFLALKDEAPDFIIKFLKMIQVRLNTPVRNIRTDNGTEFVNQTLRSYYESVGSESRLRPYHFSYPERSLTMEEILNKSINEGKREHRYDLCAINDLDETINEEAQELLANEVPDSFLSRGLEKLINQSDLECCESTSSNESNGVDSEKLIRRIDSANTSYSVSQATINSNNVKREHLYSVIANEIDEKKPEPNNFPQHLDKEDVKPRLISSMFDARHELCFLKFVSDMNASSNLRRTFTLVGNACPLTRITATNNVPLREPIPLEVYPIVLWYFGLQMPKSTLPIEDRLQLTKFSSQVSSPYYLVRGNDQIAKINGGDLDNSTSNVLIPLDSWTSGLLVYKLPLSDCDVKGVTTRGGKTTTQDVPNNDTNVPPKEPVVAEPEKPVGSNEFLTNDQPQITIEPFVQPSNEVQPPPVPFPRRLRKEKDEAQ
ncbi:retrovirus-related pol polyprotein from transposon TNT 1-94 [Tanacetum coccineum]